MKCQILFSGKTKKNNVNLSSAEIAHREVKVNESITCIVLYLPEQTVQTQIRLLRLISVYMACLFLNCNLDTSSGS